jgi:hypothetical protein
MSIGLQFLQIFFAICLYLLPAVLLAALLRIPPLYRFTQRDRSTRTGLVVGTTLLCFLIYYGGLTRLAAEATYSIAKFYFDSTFGLAPGVTLAQVEQLKWGITNELWLRALLPIASGQRCLIGTASICQLADIASNSGSPGSYSLILLAMALFAALVAFLLGLRFTRGPQKLHG